MSRAINERELGNRLRELRLQAGFTQERLAEALDMSFQQIQKYERGVTKINLSRLQQIAEALHVPITAFFNDTPAIAYHLSDEELRFLNALRRIQDSQLRASVLYLLEKAR